VRHISKLLKMYLRMELGGGHVPEKKKKNTFFEILWD